MQHPQLFDSHGAPTIKQRRGRTSTCHCGTCDKCKRRDYAREYYHGVRRQRAYKGRRDWLPHEDALLGTAHDRTIAEELGTTTSAVGNRRKKLGINRYRPTRSTRPTADGYVIAWLTPDDPFYVMTRTQGQVLEHRLIMARSLGRPLTTDEFVHHRNGQRGDNRLVNLELWTRSHPDGQRVEDVLEWCHEFIQRYETPANQGFF